MNNAIEIRYRLNQTPGALVEGLRSVCIALAIILKAKLPQLVAVYRFAELPAISFLPLLATQFQVSRVQICAG